MDGNIDGVAVVDFGIGWPAADPVLSDRDRHDPRLPEGLRDPVP
jgi:hypothetical protein